MKGRFVIILCLLASLSAMGQNRKSSAPSKSQTSEIQKDAATASDSLPGQDADKFQEITPDQVDNFCTVLLQMMNDATENFQRIRGRAIETISKNTLYTSNGGIPGAITSSLIHSASQWQYEGVLYQGNSKEEMQAIFDKCKRSLDNCLPAKGYRTSSNKNSASKLENFPEYNYSKADDDGGGPSSTKDGKHENHPRATLNVENTAGTDVYVLTLNVWSN